MVDRPPKVMHLAVDLRVDLVEVPPPVTEALHPVNPLAPDVRCKHRTEPVPPQPHCLVAQAAATLEQQVLHIPQ